MWKLVSKLLKPRQSSEDKLIAYFLNMKGEESALIDGTPITIGCCYVDRNTGKVVVIVKNEENKDWVFVPVDEIAEDLNHV